MLLHDYNWKAHYSAHMTKSAETLGFCHYRIETDSGKGEVISCTVFSGIQGIYNDLHLLRCGTPVPGEDNIVEISFCAEGRYECEVNSRAVLSCMTAMRDQPHLSVNDRSGKRASAAHAEAQNAGAFDAPERRGLCREE